MKKRVLTCLAGYVPLTPEGFKLLDVVKAKGGKVNYIYLEKDAVQC
jgi:hypothetical protein